MEMSTYNPVGPSNVDYHDLTVSGKCSTYKKGPVLEYKMEWYKQHIPHHNNKITSMGRNGKATKYELTHSAQPSFSKHTIHCLLDVNFFPAARILYRNDVQQVL